MAEKQTNKMGVVQLTIITAINMMGSGIIMLPTKLADVGTLSIISWLVTAGGSMCLAYAFAKCGMFSKRGGGMGGYSEYSFGKAGNFLANYTYGLSLVIANTAIAISAVGYASEFAGITLSPIMIAAGTIFTLWLATVLNFGGAKITGQISSFTILGVIVPVLGLCIVGWFWFSGSLWVSEWNPKNIPTFEAITMSISMTLWAFLGLESACANGDMVENPEKNIPIAVMGGTLGAAVIYILSTNIIAGICPSQDILASTAPFGLVYATMFGGMAGKVVMGLMVMSCFGSLLGWQFTIAEVFRSSAQEGYFPAIFNKVTKAGVPLMGMVIITSMQTLLAFTTVSPSLTKQFNVLVDLAVVTNVIPYLLSMASLDVIQKAAGVDQSKITTTNVIAFIGSAYSLYALYAAGLEAMTYGSLITFLGWTLYGFISDRFDMKHAIEGNEAADAAKAKA